jgi:hypothetical protein
VPSAWRCPSLGVVLTRGCVVPGCVGSQPGVKRVFGVQRVLRAGRSAFEGFVTGQTGIDGTIRDFTSVRSLLDSTPSGDRAEYLPIMYQLMTNAEDAAYIPVLQCLDTASNGCVMRVARRFV